MSSQSLLLQIFQKKLHHQLDTISIEEVLDVMKEMSEEIGMAQAKLNSLRDNQVFLKQILLNKLKNGIVDNSEMVKENEQ